MRRLLLMLGLSLLVLTLTSMAQQASPRVVHEALLRWQPTEIPGLQSTIVSGDPGAKGPFVIRLRSIRQVIVPPHWHVTDEHITVLNGSVALGFGDRYDPKALQRLRTGDFSVIPKQTRHFALFSIGTVVQVSGEGPSSRNWVDPNSVKAFKPTDVDSASDRTKMKADQDKR